jgi:hypothetical protein
MERSVLDSGTEGMLPISGRHDSGEKIPAFHRTSSIIFDENTNMFREIDTEDE